jgi:hypothetical protein
MSGMGVLLIVCKQATQLCHNKAPMLVAKSAFVGIIVYYQRLPVQFIFVVKLHYEPDIQ